MISRHTISRRTMLRGALGGSAFYLGLPLLEQMLNNHGTALAQGVALPKRYGLFFWGHGLPLNIHHNGTPEGEQNQNFGFQSTDADYWTPTTTGPDWALTELLTPLANHKANINVVTGLKVTTDVLPGQEDGHQRGYCGALSADQPHVAAYPGEQHVRVNRPTLDQFIAHHPQFYADGTPSFRSLELGMSGAFLAPSGTWICASHSGPDLLNLPIRDPKKLFDFVFAVPPDTSEMGRRVSVLDVVAGDTRRLMARLGVRDRQRLDEHLSHLNDIQHRLQKGTGVCSVPPEPAAFEEGEFAFFDFGGTVDQNPDEIYNMAKLDAIGDILVAALRCDLTRVFTVMFTAAGNVLQINAAGEINGVGAKQTHDAAHFNDHDIMMAVTKYHMTAFAMLLDKLAGETDVNGQTLLDSSCILGTSELGEGFHHGCLEMPVVIAGKAGGALDTGHHYREELGNFCRTHYTVLRALGIEESSYGFNGAETSDAFPFLKT